MSQNKGQNQNASSNVQAQVGKSEATTSATSTKPVNYVDEWQPVPLKAELVAAEASGDGPSNRHFRFKQFEFERLSLSRNERVVSIRKGGKLVDLGSEGNKASQALALKNEIEKLKEDCKKYAQPLKSQLQQWGQSLAPENEKAVAKGKNSKVEYHLPASFLMGETAFGLVLEMSQGGKDKFFAEKVFRSAKTGHKDEFTAESESALFVGESKVAAFDKGRRMEKFASIVINAAKLVNEGALTSANNKVDLLAFEFGEEFGFGSSDDSIRAMLELFATIIQLRVFGATIQAMSELKSKLEKEEKEERQAGIVDRQSQDAARKAKEAAEREKAREESQSAKA